MKKLLMILSLIAMNWHGMAQRLVEESFPLSGQKSVSIQFPFATVIDLRKWDKNEVLVKVSVEINDGEDNEKFKLLSGSSPESLNIYTEKNAYKTQFNRGDCYDVKLHYTVHLPKSVSLKVESISGDINTTYDGGLLNFKTISGDIELKVKGKTGVDLQAKTISGEIYSNLNIEHTDGKKGLNQLVGMKVKGKLNNGGELLKLETISGDIFLRLI